VEVLEHVLFTADGVVDLEEASVSCGGWRRTPTPRQSRQRAAQLLAAADVEGSCQIERDAAPVEHMMLSDTGPRVDDRVQVEARGRIREILDRDGVPGALVELDGGGQVWMPREALVLLRRRD
jgi:hypothetical protein